MKSFPKLSDFELTIIKFLGYTLDPVPDRAYKRKLKK